MDRFILCIFIRNSPNHWMCISDGFISSTALYLEAILEGHAIPLGLRPSVYHVSLGVRDIRGRTAHVGQLFNDAPRDIAGPGTILAYNQRKVTRHLVPSVAVVDDLCTRCNLTHRVLLHGVGYRRRREQRHDVKTAVVNRQRRQTRGN